MHKLLIIDGHNLLFRMFYGIPSPIFNSNGKDIRGVIGFIGGMLKAINLYDFDEMIVVFDSESSTSERLDIDTNYKGNRVDYSSVPDEENPYSQLDFIYTVLDHMKVEFIEVEGYEADDYIASLCRVYSNYEIVIISTDRDFLQLVTDKTTVYSPRGKMSIEFTPFKVYEKFSIKPSQVIDYKALVGDKSDNIIGIKSIGPKTAVKLLELGTLEELLSGKVRIDEKLNRKLQDNIDLVERNIKLITMNNEIDIRLDSMNMSINFDRKLKTVSILKECGIY